jgi:hypothetical protein
MLTPVVFANSSITMETTIAENVYVTFHFADIEPQLYAEIKDQGFSVSTVPNAVEEEFVQQNFMNAEIIYDLNQEIFNDDTNSIILEFLLTGSDIVSYTLDKTDATRSFRVRTDWRKFQVSFAEDFSLNFEEHFGTPLTDWQQVNHIFEESIADPFEMTLQFILPENAQAIQAEEDTITFKVSLAFEDSVLNSPFLILGAILVANIIVVVYRKARK